MKTLKKILLAGITATSVSGSASAAVLTVTGITGHNGGNWPGSLGHLTDMVNGNGSNNFSSGDHNTGMDTSADSSDPSTWLNTTGTWQSEWLGDGRFDSTTSINNKIGWVVFDFGSVTADLENMYLWASQFNSSGEDVRDYNVYYSSGAGIDALPSTPNSKSWAGGSQAAADYDFSSGDWTQTGVTNTLASPSGDAVTATIGLGGVSAQYVAIEILTAENGVIPDRVGIAQVEFTTTPVPEPSSLALISLCGLTLIRRRRK